MQLEQLKIKGPNCNLPKNPNLHVPAPEQCRNTVLQPSASANADAATLSSLQMQRQRLQPHARCMRRSSSPINLQQKGKKRRKNLKKNRARPGVKTQKKTREKGGSSKTNRAKSRYSEEKTERTKRDSGKIYR